LNAANSEQVFHADANGAVTAYYDNAAKLATTSTGIDVTGTVVADGIELGDNTSLFNVDKALSSYNSTNGVYLNGNSGGWLSLSGDGSQRNYIRLYGDTAATPDYIQIATAGAERMRIDASGRVGIGCTPASKLDIDISTDARGSFSSGIGEVGSGNFALQVTNSAGSALKPLGFRAEDIRFATGSAERMRIRSDGTVSILGAGNTAGGNLALGDTDNGRAKWSYITGAHYNAATETEGVAMIGMYAADGNNSVVIGGGIYETNPATNIQFWTHTASTHAQGGTQRAAIDSVGNFLVGKTSTDDSVNGFKVASTGVVTSTVTSPSTNTYLMYSGGYKFYVNTNGGISNVSANNVNLSDEREKKNIELLESQWNSLKQWSLKKFHYNADADSDNKKLGVIAQEVETHNPELIGEFKVDDDTTRMAVKEQQMMWMAIKALQEAQTRIEQLETRVTELENGE
jgi:hypothetical protein